MCRFETRLHVDDGAVRSYIICLNNPSILASRAGGRDRPSQAQPSSTKLQVCPSMVLGARRLHGAVCQGPPGAPCLAHVSGVEWSAAERRKMGATPLPAPAHTAEWAQERIQNAVGPMCASGVLKAVSVGLCRHEPLSCISLGRQKTVLWYIFSWFDLGICSPAWLVERSGVQHETGRGPTACTRPAKA